MHIPLQVWVCLSVRETPCVPWLVTKENSAGASTLACLCLAWPHLLPPGLSLWRRRSSTRSRSLIWPQKCYWVREPPSRGPPQRDDNDDVHDLSIAIVALRRWLFADRTHVIYETSFSSDPCVSQYERVPRRSSSESP